MAFGWVVAGIIMAITIIGLPWAKAAFNIAAYTLLPFGQKAVRRDSLTGRPDIGTGPLGLIGNLIWLVLAGWWLALCHLITAVILAVTIIGIPFAWAHIKRSRLIPGIIGLTRFLDANRRPLRLKTLYRQPSCASIGWSQEAQCGLSKTFRPASNGRTPTWRASWATLIAQLRGIEGCS
jgi:uncharacterized membrane protein YccF (DUF307 family)